MNLLVTGGAGFIGSNFIHYILENYPQDKVINFDALTYAGNLENLKEVSNQSNYQFVHGDIMDTLLLEKIIPDIDVIVHFAAESHVDRSILDSDAFVRTNVNGTLNLLEVAKNNGNKRFHHISTDEVFGSLNLGDPAFNESTPYDPKSPYSASKASSDHLVRSYCHTHKLPITISNCSNNYGPYQFPEKLIPFFITKLMAGEKVPVYGKGDNIRDWLHVKDHCVAIDKIIREGKIGETYCIGGNAEKTNLEITHKILELMGFDEKQIEYVDDRKGHDQRYAVDFSKIKKELGWEPQISFEEGMQETVKWYRENIDWLENIKNGNYKKYNKEHQDDKHPQV
ncbi:MAG: dTDP-glucose 4,6-dehydratase [Candidatus Moranbacteria bacterium]|jgi:dTDP-glucose 4,6-dehydratase|nr:dTDP-glucose 4,6-dehydratase [Candidatus Moranbacteria bacterium]NCA93823.1 dTDP-glucose 4,6-dehydratase [Sphingobacteriia bacterium]NLC30721.1 dTDP-glucose 4,6-dehydratase [Candidatus Moranbacteria bacterium]